jgi:hypothetical protein
LNPDLDIELFEKAVWSQDTELEVETGREGENQVGKGRQTVDAVRLDDTLDSQPDILKIDVEGAEGHVLTGARSLLEESHPTLFIEFHFDGRIESFGHNYAELKNFLENLSYTIVYKQDRGSEELVMAK